MKLKCYWKFDKLILIGCYKIENVKIENKIEYSYYWILFDIFLTESNGVNC